MNIAYPIVTIIAASAYAYAAVLNFVGAEQVKTVAEQVRVSQKWMTPFGILLAAGAIGLLVGFAIPIVGLAAAIGLILYFICAIFAHIRVRDSGFGGAVFFLVLAAGTLVANVGYHG